MECLGDLIGKAPLVYNLLDQLLVTILEILFGLGPSDSPRGLKETCIDCDVGERAIVQNLMALVIDWPGRREPHIVLNARIVDQVGVIVEDHGSRYIVQLPLPALILALLIVTNRGQRPPMTYNLGYPALFRQIFSLGLLGKKLILIPKPCHLQKSFAMIANDVVANLDLFGQLCVFHADEVLTPDHLLLAVEQKRLAGFDLDGRFSRLNIAQTDAWPLQVYVDATFFPGNFGGFSHHFDEDLVLFVLDLRRVYSANVHAFLQKLDYSRLSKSITSRLDR